MRPAWGFILSALVLGLMVAAPVLASDIGSDGTLDDYIARYGDKCGKALFEDEVLSVVPDKKQALYNKAREKLRNKGFSIIRAMPAHGAMIGIKEIHVKEDSQLSVRVEANGESGGRLEFQLSSPDKDSFISNDRCDEAPDTYATVALNMKVKIIKVESGLMSFTRDSTFDLPVRLQVSVRATGNLKPCSEGICGRFAEFDLNNSVKICLGPDTYVQVENALARGLFSLAGGLVVAAGTQGAEKSFLNNTAKEVILELIDEIVSCKIAYRIPNIVRAIAEGHDWEHAIVGFKFAGFDDVEPDSPSRVSSIGDLFSSSRANVESTVNVERLQAYISKHVLYQPSGPQQWDNLILSLAESGDMAIEPVLLQMIRKRLYHTWNADLSNLKVFVENKKGAARSSRKELKGLVRVSTKVEDVSIAIEEVDSLKIPLNWSLAHLARLRRVQEIAARCDGDEGCIEDVKTPGEDGVRMPTMELLGAGLSVKEFAKFTVMDTDSDQFPESLIRTKLQAESDSKVAISGVRHSLDLKKTALEMIKEAMCPQEDERCVSYFGTVVNYLENQDLAIDCSGRAMVEAGTMATIELQCENRLSMNINQLASDIATGSELPSPSTPH